MKKISFFLADRLQYQIDWDVAFPADHQSMVVLFVTDNNHSFGIVVRQYNIYEARFIIRGNLTSEKDLVDCLQEAVRTAMLMGCKILTTQEKVDLSWLNSFQVFNKCYFKSVNQSISLEGPFELFADRILKVESLVLQKKAFPKGSKVTCLAEGLPQARTLLNSSLMMDDFEFNNRLKIDALSPLSINYSQVAWQDDEVVGVLLVASTATIDLFDIPIRYVVPTFHHSWVNTFLTAACVRHGYAVKAKRIRFEANLVLHKETISFAKKSGCQITNNYSRFEKDLLV